MTELRDDEQRSVMLRDGQRICFAEYDDPSGVVVLNAHGGLCCRLDVAAAAPVDIWAGNQDQLVPYRWAVELACRIPNARLRIRAGGHFVAHTCYADLRGAVRVSHRQLFGPSHRTGASASSRR